MKTLASLLAALPPELPRAENRREEEAVEIGEPLEKESRPFDALPQFPARVSAAVLVDHVVGRPE